MNIHKMIHRLALALALAAGSLTAVHAIDEYSFTRSDTNAEIATIATDGTVTATGFAGDGSALTGIPAGTPADGSVTEPKLAPGAVTSTKIGDNEVTAAKVAFNYATSVSEGGPATTATDMAANPAACASGTFGTDTDTKAALVCSAVTTGDIAGLSGSNTGDQTVSISGGGITAAGSTGVLNASIDASAVTTGKLAADAVTAVKILNGVVSEAKLSFDPATQSELNTHDGIADAHFVHPTTLAELNTDIGSGLVTGAHTVDTNTQNVIDDTPSDGNITQSASSNSLFDHDAAADAHYVHATTLGELNTDLGSSIADGAHTADPNGILTAYEGKFTIANLCLDAPAAVGNMASTSTGQGVFDSTGTLAGQWRSIRTGVNACALD